MMKRLWATIRCDVRLQFRNGFYYATVFMLVFWTVFVKLLPTVNWGLVMPALMLGNLLVTTFYFVGGLVLLEKTESTLEAQVVTPLRTWEYLASKVVTLTALTLVESALFVLIAIGTSFSVLPLIIGVVSACVIYTLIGFVAVARYDSISEYLFPSCVYLVILCIPFIPLSGLADAPLYYLHPLQPPLSLIKAAFAPVARWELIYGVVCSAVWFVPCFAWGLRAFDRFVIAKRGATR
jgi:fluoroquinolone transport system permease protein